MESERLCWLQDRRGWSGRDVLHLYGRVEKRTSGQDPAMRTLLPRAVYRQMAEDEQFVPYR